MKTMKKIGAIVIVVMMVLGMSSMAFAAGTLTAGVDGDGVSSITTLTFEKQIKVFNPESTTVRLPAITYTYTISPVTVDSTAPTVTDSDPHSATVLSGVTVTDIFTAATQTVSFAQTDTVTANSSGVLSDPKDVTFTVKDTLGASVTRAGIYRFQVAETIDLTSKAAAGIEEPSGYAGTKYLDVYVGNVNNELKVVGFVLFDSADATTQSLNATNASTYKSDGWGQGEGSSAVNTDIDEYHTTNLTITKTTAGSLADKLNKFPIAIRITKAAGLTNDVTVDVSVSSDNTLTSGSTASLGTSVTFEASLKNGGELYIKGIPYYADSTSPAYATIVGLTETNNTPDQYSQSIALTSVSGITAPSTATIGGGTALFTCTNATLSDDDTVAQIDITNTMDTVSPTGYAARFAPYAIMLAAGVVIFILSRRRKENKEDA